MMLIPIFGSILLIAASLTIFMLVKNFGNLGMKKAFHRNLVIVYLILLLGALIVSEIMQRTNAAEAPPVVSANEMNYDIYFALSQGSEIPENRIASRRTHEVDGKLFITSKSQSAYILIERSKEKGNTVTETIYKPELYTGYDEDRGSYYDLSDRLQFKLPEWDSSSMTVPRQPVNQIHYTFYHDSNMISQFTGQPRHRGGSGSASTQLLIHLSIPESVELDIPSTENENGTFIDYL